MRYLIVKRTDKISKKVSELIINKCNDCNFTYISEKEISTLKDDEKLDIVFSIGGDGTFLRSVHYYHKFNPIFININTGTFGYLCEFKIDEIEEIFPRLFQRSINYKEVSLLRLDKYKFKEESNSFSLTNSYFALNEFRIASINEATIKFDIYIDNTFLECLRGDGCVISSSLGSSGITKSLKGALVDNEIEMLEFVENAPIFNKKYHSISSPFVLNKDKEFKLTNFFHNSFNVYYDCESLRINNFTKDDYISIYLDQFNKIRILTNPKTNYIEKTREMFAN